MATVTHPTHDDRASVPGAALWQDYFRSAPHGMVVFRATRNPAGRLDDFAWVDLNPAATMVLGLRREEVLGRMARSVYPDQLDPRIYRRLVTAHVTARVQEFEQAMPVRGGSAGVDRGSVVDRRPGDGSGSVRGLPEVTWFAVTVLPLSDDYIVVQFRSITHYKNVLRQAVELMNHDDLTGLPNRRHLKSRFWVLRRQAVPMALLYFDLNGFKAVNDSHGHEMGDRVLSVIGQRLKQNVRPGEMVARLGGDEFAVLLAGADLNSVDRVAERLLQAVEEPIHLDRVTVRLSASVGAGLYPLHAESFEALLSFADARMYEQKRQRA